MAFDTSLSPYYDDFDPTRKYTQLLALPGRAEQAREFTQIQSMMLYFLKQMGSTLFREGNVVNGMAFSLKNNVLTVEPGQVYLDGIVHNFDGGTLTITSTGLEDIGIKLVKTIVTEAEDPSLRDPAQGYANYAQPGAHRIKAVPTLTLNDITAPTLYQFLDGSLQSDTSPKFDGGISDMLARRTYDEAGNYKVYGLTIFTAPKSSSTLSLTVDAGKAYVKGYEVEKPSPFKVEIGKAQVTRTVQNEPKIYHAATPTYLLNNQPVKSIDRVVAIVSTTQNVTRGSLPNGIDYLPKSPVLELVSVTQGGTTYVQGRDFQLTSDGVDWSLVGGGAIEPSVGTTYSVTWKYTKSMVQDVDYKLTVVGTGDAAKYYLDFGVAGGDKPVESTQINVDYQFYLARKDLISLNKKGEVIITAGQSEVPRLIATPSVSDPDLLNLGTVYLPPNSDNAICNSYAVTRLSMEDLQNAVKRISDTEYNQALTQLDNEAMNGEDSTALKGIFSDGFVGLTKVDLTHPLQSLAFSVDEGALVLPATNIKAVTPTINLSTSQAKVFGRLLTAPMTESVTINQSASTGTMLVNPYSVFNKMATMSLTPSVDNWVDETLITVQKNATATYTIHRWWYHGGDLYNDTERYLFNNLQLDAGQRYDGWDNITGTITSSTSRTILDEAIQYMRQRQVTVYGYNFIPLTDNLQLSFDGIAVSVNPGSGAYAGAGLGTLKADSTGFTWGTFMVPSGVRCGTRDVTIKNDNNLASTPYTANGRMRTVENTVLRTRVTLLPYDPLAQSFQFDQDRILTSVGVFFAIKDSVKNVTVQIRNMVNGYPGQVIMAEKVLSPSQVATSTNGSTETKISFADPVACKANVQYCVVVLTDSDAYSMHVAELGAKDLLTGAIVSKQPYVDGVLFSSSNAITWTANQTKDMKFKIYTGTFATNGSIEFNPIPNLQIDRLVMFADYLTPQNTGCQWQARMDGGTYQPIENYVDMDLSAVTGSVQLKATFNSTGSMSPLLSQESFTLIGFVTAASGSYISKNTTMAQQFTTVKQSFEAYVPSGCSVVPKFATDTNGTVWQGGTLVSTEPVDGYYVRYTYQANIPASTNFRARLDVTAPNQLSRPKVRKFINIMK